MGCFFFFFQKSTIEVLFTWSDSFPPFCPPPPPPLPGNLENAKKLKVRHADAESSLDVLGVWPWVHDCAYHRRNCPSTTADPKLSSLHLSTTILERGSVWETQREGKERECDERGWRRKGREGERERERNLQDSSRFQEAVPLITCVTLDDIRSQILDFTANHQGKFLPVQSLHKLPFGLFGTPCPAGIL